MDGLLSFMGVDIEKLTRLICIFTNELAWVRIYICSEV